MTDTVDILSRAKPVSTDAPLALWLLDLSGPPPAEAVGWLSDEERDRAARFAFPRHRDRYLNAHVALRAVLQEHCGLDARHQRFVLGAHGKPQLVGPAGWQFSLSYAEDVALMGIDYANHVGVDIERDRMIPEAEELSALHFHPRERCALVRLPPSSRCGAAFLRGWTRKEACLKALGCGLTMPTAQFHSGLTRRKPVRIDGRVLLEVECCSPLPGFTAAWARTIDHREGSAAC